jgi:hypothetical protein
MDGFFSPVGWAQFGRLSRLIAKTLKPVSPSVLVLSMPRSGSSWVGETLGISSGALYLREPLTQTNKLFNGKVVEVLTNPPPAAYEQCADVAFMGLPAFNNSIVTIPSQWSLLNRSRRKVVIKEVALWALHWLVHRYQPRTILLVRHPVAVLLSYVKVGWIRLDVQANKNFMNTQAKALRWAFDTLQHYPNHKVVVYEELCANPLMAFKPLFEFAGLDWSQPVEQFILEHSSDGQHEDPYSTHRNSREMANAWKGELTADEINELREAYMANDPPWYNTPELW